MEHTDNRNTYERIPLALIALLAVFVVAGLAASRLVALPGDVTGLPDLSNADIVEIRDASGRGVLNGEFRDRADAAGNAEKDAALIDRRGRRVIGEIEIEIPGPSANNPAQELEIDIIELRPSAKYAVFIDDREVATFTTDDRGSVDMEIHSAPPASAR